MIGYLSGTVLLSDGQEILLQTQSGIGYEIEFSSIIEEGSSLSLYIAHIIKEDDQRLFGFKDLKSKKMFELLLKVKGVGPRSAYLLVTSLGTELLCDAILMDNQKTLKSAPGVGAKMAAQIVLDLKDKIKRVQMFSKSYTGSITKHEESDAPQMVSSSAVLRDAIMACKELGFKESNIEVVAKRILEKTEISKAEQLVHLILKEM